MTEADSTVARTHVGRWLAWGLMCLLLLYVMAGSPFAYFDGYFWDDWTVLWLFKHVGVGSLYSYSLQIAHPLFAPVSTLPLFAGEEWAGRSALVLSMLCRAATAYLLFRTLDHDGTRLELGLVTAAVFLLSPVYDSRGVLVLWHYDVFVLAYVASIRLSGTRSTAGRASALILCLIGLSVEPLASLEPLRWWYLGERTRNVRAAVLMSLPCLGTVLVYAVSRLTWFKPFGVYAGYNSFAFGLTEILGPFEANLKYPLLMLKAIPASVLPFRTEQPAIVGGFVLFSLACMVPLLQVRKITRRRLVGVWGAAILVWMLGAAAVAAIGQTASQWHFSVRFAVAIQIAFAIAAGAMIASLPFRTFRYLIAAGAVFCFAVFNFQYGKWALYDRIVIEDFRAQAAALLRRSPPQVMWVRFDWESGSGFFRDRCLSANDTNVRLGDLGIVDSFVYDLGCFRYPPDNGLGRDWCTVSGRDTRECPGLETWARFEVNSRVRPYTFYSLAQLVAAIRSNESWGTLEPSTKP